GDWPNKQDTCTSGSFNFGTDAFEHLAAQSKLLVTSTLEDYEPKTVRTDQIIYLKLGPKSFPNRRGGQTWIQNAAREMDAHLRERPRHLSRRVPSNATFQQAQHIDAMRSTQKQEQDEDKATTATLLVSIKGSTPMRLTFNVSAMRRVIEMPKYNFLA
ncbi:hypothetical protein GN958_ATG20528, partial [Phytophthora infestans]